MPLKRSRFFINDILISGLLGCMAPLLLLPGASARGQDQPNLIFILTDDQGAESIGATDSQGFEIFGNEMGALTPTMSRMAAIGVSFSGCRVNPNCSPTRTGLMTGRSALKTGVTGVIPHYAKSGDEGGDPCTSPAPPPLRGMLAQAVDSTSLLTHERTIAEALHDAGYYTILIDKWHIGADHVGDDGGEDRGTSPDEQGFDEVRN